MKKYLFILFLGIYTTCVFGQSFPFGDYNLISSCSDDFNSTTKNGKMWHSYWATYAENTVFDSVNNIKYGQTPSISLGANNYVCQIISKYVTTPQLGTYWDDKTKSVQKSPANTICGQLMTQQSYKYGYYEVKMKEPNSNVGICSAYWLWSGNDEIDVQENCSNSSPSLTLGLPYKSIVRNAINYVPAPWPYAADIPIKDNNGNYIDLTQAFHTYGLDWQPGYIDFYFDGSCTSHVVNGYNGMQISNFQPMPVVIWTKAGDLSNPPSTDGSSIIEIDYFHYFKRKPIINNAIYNSSSNTITLTVSTENPYDTYNWTHGSYININGAANTNVANISLSSAYNGTSVTVSANGTNPVATSSSTFTFQQNSSNICGNLAQSNVYLGTNINAPQSGCFSTVVLNGTNIIFVAPGSISLNPGFEVQLGGTFSALTQ